MSPRYAARQDRRKPTTNDASLSGGLTAAIEDALKEVSLALEIESIERTIEGLAIGLQRQLPPPPGQP